MNGFTLVEFLIYIAIFATILVLLTGFLWLIVLGNIKETSYQEVQQNGRFALAKISQEIKKATGIISPPALPPPDNSANSLSLAMTDPNLNPTVFDIDNGKLRITQGANSSYLTTDQVIISNIQFTNLSYSGTPGTVRVEMQIDHLNPGNRIEYQASVNLTSSVSLVPGGAVPFFEIKRPTSFIDVAERTTNLELAFDPINGTTFSTTVYRGTGDSIIFHTWQLPTQTYTSLVLKFRYHAEGATNDTYAVAYSIDGGFSWIDLISPTSASAPDTTIPVSLSPTQDLSQLRVKIYTSQIAGPDNRNIFTRDIWTEGSF